MKTYQIRIRQGDLEVALKSEDKAFVEAQIKRFFSPSSAPRSNQRESSNGNGQQGQNPQNKPISLAEFKKQVGPGTGTEYVACVAYWLEKFQKLKEFTTKQLLAGLKEAKLNVKNPSDAILKAKGAGVIMDGQSKGHLMLSGTGENLIEELLRKKTGSEKV